MTFKDKKVPRTINLYPETWEYLEKMATVADRKVSQEIEQIIKVVRNQRLKGNEQAFKLAEQDTPPQS